MEPMMDDLRRSSKEITKDDPQTVKSWTFKKTGKSPILEIDANAIYTKGASLINGMGDIRRPKWLNLSGALMII